MKRYSLRGVGKYLDGYTLIEVMIFLAVSGALLVSAMTFISGRQARIRYTQAVVDFEQQLQDTFNDVSTGYYPTNSDYSCTYDGANIVFSTATDTSQGSNEQCIFAGKLIHFFPNGDLSGYKIYTIVGPSKMQSINSSQVKLLGATGGAAGSNPGIAELKKIQSDIQFTKTSVGGSGVRQLIDTGNPSIPYHSFAIIPDYGGSNLVNNSVSGNASKVKLYGYESGVDSGPITPRPSPPATNPKFIEIKGNLVICMRQDGNGRPSAIVVTKQLTIERWIDKQPSECG